MFVTGKKSSIYNINKIDRLKYLSSPSKKRLIHFKNSFIKSVYLDKLTIASIVTINNNHTD